MALYYLAGFSTAGSAQSMTGTIAGNAMTVASGTYAFAAFTSLTGTGTFTAFAAAVKAAADTAGGGPYTVTYSTSTHAFTISRATTFTFAFSTAADLRLRSALGFAANLSGANTYTSTVRPYYVIVPAMGARTAFSDVYEPADIVEEAGSDGGTYYAVARQTTELLCDWSQTMESKAATLSRSAASSAPWTWEAFVKHVRGQYPFGVYESATSNNLYKLRAEGASFKPERVAADYDGLWNIPFSTRDLGLLP